MLINGAEATAVRVKGKEVHLDCLYDSEILLTMVILDPQHAPDRDCPRCGVSLKERPQP